jgi:hypothetical protein
LFVDCVCCPIAYGDDVRIKAQEEKEFADLGTTKPTETSDGMLISLFGTFLDYVGTLFLLFLRRAIRG